MREGLAHAQRAVAERARPARLVPHAHAELGKRAIDQRELLGRRVPHRHLAAGDGAQREEGDDLVEILREGELGAVQRIDTGDDEARGADAVDARAHRCHEAAELLHMRLAGGVGQRRRAAGQRGAHHEAFGGGDRGVVEPVLRGFERPVAAHQQRIGGALDARAEVTQHLDMRIDLAHAQRAATHVVLDACDAEARQQRRHQQDR